MSEQVVAPKLPAVIASRYVPIRLIGRGGMGMVYEVEHARTGEHLALKVLLSTVDPSPEALARFKREARASARIKSENVVRVTDADVAPEMDGAPFLVMELLEGMDIEKAAGASRPTPTTVVDWLRQVARAVDKAHGMGIVHRDLKPENLFLANVENRAPIVKILDFGIAKMAQEGATATGSGQVLGTPKYMAPEQAAGGPLVTSATDLYALGLIAYRLIMGESYYRDDNVMSILGLLLHGQLELPSLRNPNFGAAFDDWFSKACHKEPQGRFASAAIQVEALAEALGLPTVPIEPPRDRPSPSGSPPVDALSTLRQTPDSVSPVLGLARAKSRRGVLFSAVGVAVLIAVAAVLVYRGSNTDRATGEPAVATTPATPPATTSKVVVAPTVAPPAMPGNATPDQPPGPAPSSVAAPSAPAVPAAVSGAERSTGKKSRPAARGLGAGAGAKRPPSQAADPFRDQK